MKGILGKKIGMSRIFNSKGEAIPVTMIEAGPCTILDVKPNVLKLGFGNKREKSVKKPQLGEFKKLKVPAKRIVKEIPFSDTKNYKIAEEVKADVFAVKECVDVRGRSIGKGFQGGMKRWGWHGGPETHGSMHHRRVGSIGASSDPSRVYRGQHMPGHMGDRNTCVQNLEIISIEGNIMTVKGAVPGKGNNYLVLTHSKKMPVKKDKQIQKVSTKDALKASKRAAKGRK